MVGYLISTRLLFPAPAPPRDLLTVPDLTGETLEVARERLESMGLFLTTVDSVHHPGRPFGEIFGQSPLPGQLARPDDTARIAVSLGPQLRSVPDVRRLRGEQARTILEASGFRVTVDSVEAESPKGTVVRMDPTPETEVALPADLALSVSQGPMVVEMPLLLGIPQEEAVARLDSLGLTVSEVEERFRFGAAQGLVVEQEPPAGTVLRRGEEVRLAVGRRRGGRDTTTSVDTTTLPASNAFSPTSTRPRVRLLRPPGSEAPDLGGSSRNKGLPNP